MDRQFDESVMYHLLTQVLPSILILLDLAHYWQQGVLMHYRPAQAQAPVWIQVQLIRTWPIAGSKEFSCIIDPHKLKLLYGSMNRSCSSPCPGRHNDTTCTYFPDQIHIHACTAVILAPHFSVELIIHRRLVCCPLSLLPPFVSLSLSLPPSLPLSLSLSLSVSLQPRYLCSLAQLLAMEEQMIEEATNRRFIRSRHFTRCSYIVDCIRVASLQHVDNTVAAWYGPDQRRFLQVSCMSTCLCINDYTPSEASETLVSGLPPLVYTH